MAADLMLNDQYTGAFKDFIFLFAFGLLTFLLEYILNSVKKMEQHSLNMIILQYNKDKIKNN